MPSTLELARRAPALIKKLSTDRTTPQHKAPPQLLQKATIQRALANPHRLTPAEVPQLQRIMGNGAVSDLLGRSRQEGTGNLRVGASNDAHEREARQVAAAVGGAHAVQRASGSVSEVTEEPEIGSAGGMVNRQVENTIQAASSGGKAVPDEVRMKVENETGHSFEGVKVHQGAHADQANRAMGARAFTQGKHIYLGQNQSPHDLQLMAHELTHTVQQGATGNANGGVADIQRETEDEKRIKKLNKKIGRTKLKKGLTKFSVGFSKAVDMLVTSPFRLIDQASVLDLHLKDFGNFVKTGKTRKQRSDGGQDYNTGNLKRTAGRTGLRALLSGINIRGGDPRIPLLHSPLNPFLNVGIGQGVGVGLNEKYNSKLSQMRLEKQEIRNGMNPNNPPVPLGNDLDNDQGNHIGNNLGNDIGNNNTGNEVDEEVVTEIISNLAQEEELNN